MDLLNKVKTVVKGFLAAFLVCTPVWGDDTEIFFGGSTNTTVRPNILFILDTSGSMTRSDTVNGVNLGVRATRLKEAMRAVLGSAQDVNIGLMRFNNPNGGPILAPVRDLDMVLSGDAPVDSGRFSRTVTVGVDDAEEATDGTVTLDRSGLALISRSGSTTSETLERVVDSSKDDAEEFKSSGDMYLSSSDIEMLYDDEAIYAGLRFNQIDIPKGATIDSAKVVFTSRGKRSGLSGTTKVDIYGEKVSTASTFSSSDDNISSRSRTSAKVDWDMPSSENPKKNVEMDTPDLKSLISEVTGATSDWSTGNSLAFIFAPESTSNKKKRRFYSYDESQSRAPRLEVTYTKTLPTISNRWIGLRFNEVQIPQGATISSAKLVFTAEEDSAAGGSLSFRAEDVDNSAVFEATANNLNARSKTTALVSETSLPAVTANEYYTSPELKSVVQEVVDRTGWCGGNSMAFMVSGTGASLFAGSAELGTGVRLEVEFDPASVSATSCYGVAQSYPMTAGKDDVMQIGSSSLYSSENFHALGSYGSQSTHVGFRFNDVYLNKSAELMSAYLELKTSYDTNTPANLTIEVQAHDNAPEFGNGSSSRPGSRSTVSTRINWNISESWSAGSVIRSPDISAAIEQVIARSNWAPGNSIVVIISGTGVRYIDSYEGSTIAPKLVVTAKRPEFSALNTTVRDDLLRMVDELTASGWTPLVDVLYEAALYYRGEEVDYGKQRGNGSGSSNQSTRVSHPASYTGGTVVLPPGCSNSDPNSAACLQERISGTPIYISPMTESCQSNHIVLLTDGEATKNASAEKVRQMIGKPTGFNCHSSGAEACGHDLAEFLSGEDQNSILSGAQNVKVHTIGFNFSNTWLKELATVKGGGSFTEASSTTELVQAFDTLVKSIKAVDTSFVQAGVTVNQFNRLSHRDDIYFSLFKPQETAKWYGNLKKYRLTGADSVVTDVNGNPAVDATTGFFKVDAKSYWSTAIDGEKVELGGAASQLPVPSSRLIYTYLDDYPVVQDGTELLTNYPVNHSNTAISKDLLDIIGSTDDYRTNLLKWARGENGSGGARQQLGDPLHSVPELVTYSATQDSDGNPVYDSTIYFGTNEGYIHAINAETGQEQFSFIPKELLKNLDVFYSNQNVSPRPYGMDGSVTTYLKDHNGDGDLNDTDDTVWIYSGMRRGGRNYYSLDVRDRSAPKLKWVIKGGADGTTGFEELGQTWSRPKNIQVPFDANQNGVIDDGEVRNLLLFAGGYDPQQDNVSTRTADTMGRALYMVDADTGALFWSAGIASSHDLTLTDMKYSIPSDITVLDMDRDGWADQLYVGDMGGQMWRFDIAENATQKADLVSGGVIADLSTDGSAANNRRFYYPPDASLYNVNSEYVMVLAIGSGWRAHPLNDVVQDRFYSLRQYNGIFSAPSSYTTVTETDLYDSTNNLVVEGTDTEKAEAQESLSVNDSQRKQGWFIRLENTGEKVLGNSLTANKQIIFTTYEPTPPAVGSCQAGNGIARAYIVDPLDATPLLDMNVDGTVNKNDRSTKLKQGSIPASPKLIDTDAGKPVVLIGPEKLAPADAGKQLFRTYWVEQQ